MPLLPSTSCVTRMSTARLQNIYASSGERPRRSPISVIIWRSAGCTFRKGGANAVQVKGGSSDLTVLRCHFEDCGERGARLSLARFFFEEPLDRRTSMDAARLISRLVRNFDFACRQDDGSILFAFGDTELRDAHVAARRLASVLKHTMLRADRERPGISPAVTLATLKPADTMHTLLARVAPRPVAAA